MTVSGERATVWPLAPVCQPRRWNLSRLEQERTNEILATFSERRFLVIGDLMVDRYIYGQVSRISPEAPVPVVRVDREEERLGGAANVAHNLARLGARVDLCGLVGDDREGRLLAKTLKGMGIGTDSLVITPDRPTTRKVRVIAHQQQIVRVDYEVDEPAAQHEEQAIHARIEEARNHVDGIILSDYGKGVVTEETIRAVARSAPDAYVAVDPKVKHFSQYRGVSLVTPNLSEAGLAAGEAIRDEESLLRAASRLQTMLPGTTLLITRGEDGMSLFEPDRDPEHIPTVARRVFDVTGAGDTVIATFALAMTAGAGAKEAAMLANYAAGRVIQEVGAHPIERDELRDTIREALSWDA